MWNQRKPYLGFMRTFGSKAIALRKGIKGNKFEAKGKPLIMVGYSSESKAYRLWCPKTKTIIKSRDVRFLENVMLEEEKTNEILEIPINMKINENKEDLVINENLETTEIQEDENEEEEFHTPSQNATEDASDEEHQEESTAEDSTSTIDETPLREPVKREQERPKKLLTGKPGRPKKLFHEVSNKNEIDTEEPLKVSDVLQRKDRKS